MDFVKLLRTSSRVYKLKRGSVPLAKSVLILWIIFQCVQMHALFRGNVDCPRCICRNAHERASRGKTMVPKIEWP